MKKPVFYTELAYVLGLVLLGFGTAFMEAGDFGMSMIVAPAYLIYLKVSKTVAWFTFGMSEYLFQIVLLAVMCLVLRRFRLSYLFSFATAFIYGWILDGCCLLVRAIPCEGIPLRLVFYIGGMLISSLSICFLYHTYLSPEVYELCIAEISDKFGFPLSRCKTVYDCTSCLFAVILSFLFFGLWHFEGVNVGTIVCALINGTLIGLFSKIFEKHYVFEDRFPKGRVFFKGKV